MTKQDTVRQGKSSHTKAGQGTPTGGEKSQGKAKESKTHLFPLSGVPQKHQANDHNIYAEDLLSPSRP